MKLDWPKLALRWKEALGKYKYVLLVIGLGVVLMALPTTGQRDKGQEGAQAPAEGFDLEAFEEKMERALSQVEGAGEVRVVLTQGSNGRQRLAQDQERDREGGGSSTTVTVGRGSGQQEVVPLQTLAPEFRGALVVCPGGGNPRIQLRLLEAVSALTGLGTDRISICKGNT